MSKKKSDLFKRIEDGEGRIKQFGDLLDELETTDEKKKMLWKQIYTNAVEDRESASMLYSQLLTAMAIDVQGHINSGPMLTKYLEKMGKSNDQLIKLAEMIAASDKNKNDSPEDMFNAIGDE